MGGFHNGMPQTANAAAAALTSCLPGFILFNAEKYIIKNQPVTFQKSDF